MKLGIISAHVTENISIPLALLYANVKHACSLEFIENNICKKKKKSFYLFGHLV